MTDQEILRIATAQEELFQFEHFHSEDAWKLGNILVEIAKEKGFAPALSIRLNNGFTLFQFGFDNTGLDHENWMQRKLNTTKVKQFSTLKAMYLLKTMNITLADWFMEEATYSTCPGAFPIKIKGTGMIGTILVSGISVEDDHNLIIEALMKYFDQTVEMVTL